MDFEMDKIESDKIKSDRKTRNDELVEKLKSVFKKHKWGTTQ